MPEPAALYPGPGLPAGVPSLQESEHLPQEAGSQDPGGSLPRRHPQRPGLGLVFKEVIGRRALSHLRLKRVVSLTVC